MRYSLINLVACPECKNFPLKLIVFEKKEEPRDFKVEEPFCDLYCGLREKYIKDIKEGEMNCKDCLRNEIVSGILICNNCNRWFPILEGIPRMLPDRLRKKKKEEDVNFLRKYVNLIPKDILESGLPHNLKSV
jgi:uncharacterized protein YbaR (Trm112 family)